MPYTPEEYERLKAACKEELKKRRAFLEAARVAHLRQKAQWHLTQMEAALQALGYDSPASPNHSASSLPSIEPAEVPSRKTLF